MLTSKYFRHANFLEVVPAPGSSWVWKGILRIRHFIDAGRCILPKNGQAVNIRNDPWLPGHPNKRPTWRVDNPGLQMVADLVDPDSGIWDPLLVRNHFDAFSASLILKLPAPRPDAVDQIIWTLDPSGCFSIKSVVDLSQQSRCPIHKQERQRISKKLWQFDMQDRLKLLMWKVASNALPLRGIFSDGTDPCLAEWAPCPLCSVGAETPLHLFTQCVIAQVLWRQSLRPIDVSRLPLPAMKDLVGISFYMITVDSK